MNDIKLCHYKKIAWTHWQLFSLGSTAEIAQCLFGHFQQLLPSAR